MGAGTQNPTGAGSPSQDEIRAELQKILASPLFNGSERPSRFLRYAVERALDENTDRLKEYDVGVEVLGRPTSFDPRLDPIVRVEATRLRARLADYYARFGANDPVLIDLPKGTYLPVFRIRSEEKVVASPREWARAHVRLWLVIAGIGAFTLLVLRMRRFEAQSPAEMMQMERLTTTGKVVTAAISPDGKFVAHADRERDQESLRVRQTGVANDVEILPPRRIHYQGLVYSPDGALLYYVETESNNRGTLYAIPSPGGAPRLVLDDVDDAPSFSPDGNSMAFESGELRAREFRLFRFDIRSGSLHKLASRRVPEQIMGGTAWSRDGSVLRFVQADRRHQLALAGIPREGGAEQLTALPKSWSDISGFALLPGSETMLAAVSTRSEPHFQIWEYGLSGGPLRRVTNDLNNYAAFSLSADGNTIAAVQRDIDANIWIIARGAARQVTSGNEANFGEGGLAWTGGNRLVYGSRESGGSDLWSMDENGQNRKQLTFDGSSHSPAVCDSGRTILFLSERNKLREIWRMDSDGGNQRVLARGKEFLRADCAPEGDWVVAMSFERTLHWIPISGGEPTPLVSGDFIAGNPTVSPEGAIAYSCNDNTFNLCVLPSSGERKPRALKTGGSVKLSRWTPDGGAIAYIRPLGANIFAQPLEGGPPQQITQFDSQQIVAFAWSKDGSLLAVSRRAVRNDVVLIRNFHR